MRDFQKSRVYKWENQFPEGDWIDFYTAQIVVDYVWKDMGLEYPPKVQSMHKNDRHAGKANRLSVLIPENGCSTKTLLHELAHSLTFDIDGAGNWHGVWFVGVYMKLMEKFLGVPLPLLWYSANAEGVKYEKFPVIKSLIGLDNGF